MARLKDINWNMPEGVPTTGGAKEYTWSTINAALLMDIRDELHSMNAILHCRNFLHIPQKLDEIRRNTKRKARSKK